LIAKVIADGPASKSELKEQDVILEVNGKSVANSRDLARTIAALTPGSEARLHIVRKGKEIDLSVNVGEYTDGDKVAALSGGGSEETDSSRELEDLGLRLVPAPDPPGSEAKEGVAVSDVDPSSRAADLGVKRGDIIIEVDSKPVSTADDVMASIRQARDR